MRALSPVRSAELTGSGRLWPWTLAGLFLAALALRWGYVLELADLASFRRLVMDAALYDQLAGKILSQGWMPEEPFSQTPLYPYFLAVVYSLFGVSYTAARLVQGVLGAATVVLVAAAAGRSFGRPAGLAAGFLGVFYGPLVFYTGLLWKPTLTLFLLAWMLFLLAGDTGRAAGPGRLLAVGALLGAAGLVRENVLLLAPFVALFVWLEPSIVSRGLALSKLAWKRVSLVAAGGVLALLPVVLLNVHASGEWILTSAPGGILLYMGNSPQATGTYVPFSEASQGEEQLLEDARRTAARLLAERTAQPVAPEDLTDAEASRVLRNATLRAIAAHPLRWLGLMARKARLFWNAYEIPDAEGWVVHRQLSAVLSLAPVSFGLVAPLALLGLVPAFRRFPREAWLLAAAGAGIFAAVTLFFVFSRYRLPIVPFLLPPAGLAVVWMGRLTRDFAADRSRFKPLAAAAAALGVLALLVQWPAFDEATRREHTAALWFNLGSAAQQLAGEVYDEAAASPRVVPRGLARSAQAVGFLRHAVDASPGFAVARVELGVALHRRAIFLELAGRPHEALPVYEAAVERIEEGLRMARAGQGPPDLVPRAEATLEVVRGNLERLRRLVVKR